jgi:hypothetical protein
MAHQMGFALIILMFSLASCYPSCDIIRFTDYTYDLTSLKTQNNIVASVPSGVITVNLCDV